MKLGQLIEQNMRNVFLEKAYTKYGGESTCRPFSKKIEHTSASTVWTFIQLSLFAYPSWGMPKYIESALVLTKKEQKEVWN